MRISRATAACAATITTLALAGCSQSANPATASASPAPDTEVTVVTHDSFAMPDEVVAQFEKDTGIHVTFVAPGDAGTVTNQLILTKNAPIGDVAYGVDNTFASRALKEGVFADYVSSEPAAADAAKYAVPGLEGSHGHRLLRRLPQLRHRLLRSAQPRGSAIAR